MFKTLIAAAMAAALGTPVLAMEPMKCDNASMMKAEEHAKALKGDMMTASMKHVDLAKTAMKDGKNDECAMHLDEAMKVM